MPKKDGFFYITLSSAVAVALIIASILVFKFFLKEEFKEIKKFYTEEFLSETNANEVLKEDKAYEV